MVMLSSVVVFLFFLAVRFVFSLVGVNIPLSIPQGMMLLMAIVGYLTLGLAGTKRFTDHEINNHASSIRHYYFLYSRPVIIIAPMVALFNLQLGADVYMVGCLNTIGILIWTFMLAEHLNWWSVLTLMFDVF